MRKSSLYIINGTFALAVTVLYITLLYGLCGNSFTDALKYIAVNLTGAAVCFGIFFLIKNKRTATTALFTLATVLILLFILHFLLSIALLIPPLGQLLAYTGIFNIVTLSPLGLFLYVGPTALLAVILATVLLDNPVITKRLYVCFFVLYIIVLIYLLFFALGHFGITTNILLSPKKIKRYLRFSFNVIPFKTIKMYLSKGFTNYTIRNLLGNFVVFMPFSLFLPEIFKGTNKLWHFILTVLLINISVEVLQFFFLTGGCDIDDIILNTGGAIIAYIMLKLLRRANKKPA